MNLESGPGGLPVGGRKQVGFGFFSWQLGTDRSYTRAGSKGRAELQPRGVCRKGFPLKHPPCNKPDQRAEMEIPSHTADIPTAQLCSVSQDKKKFSPPAMQAHLPGPEAPSSEGTEIPVQQTPSRQHWEELITFNAI